MDLPSFPMKSQYAFQAAMRRVNVTLGSLPANPIFGWREVASCNLYPCNKRPLRWGSRNVGVVP